MAGMWDLRTGCMQETRDWGRGREGRGPVTEGLEGQEVPVTAMAEGLEGPVSAMVEGLEG